MLWIEAFEGSDFLEGARTHQGSRVRFHCYLEKFCATFTPHFCGVLLLRIFAEYFYSAFLRSTFYSANLQSNPVYFIVQLSLRQRVRRGSRASRERSRRTLDLRLSCGFALAVVC